MDNIIDNRFLVTSTVTKEVSGYSSRSLEYDFDEVISDVSASVGEYHNSINLDRRVIAVGAVAKIHLWDVMASSQLGWKDHIFISSSLYFEMLADLINPTDVLITEPDTHFNIIALLASRGCNLTFINNEALFIFERFVRDTPSYPFSFSYRTIDMEDLPDMAESFDLIHAPMYDFGIDNTFMNDVLNSARSGGVVYAPYANESGRLYTDDYYMEPVTDIYDLLLERNDVQSYHIPNNIGFQIIVKK